MIRTALLEVLNNYIFQKSKTYAHNTLASNIRHKYPAIIRDQMHLGNRYLVQGSCGSGQWADCPWIAIMDTTLTTTVQKEYYIVFLFKTDMSGVYLSLHQGVTTIRENYHQDALEVLRNKSQDFRSKILNPSRYHYDINLNSSSKSDLSKFYEAANIIACYYELHNFPSEEHIHQDLLQFIEMYQNLVYGDTSINLETGDEAPSSVEEHKKLSFHKRIDRNIQVTKKVKQRKGCRCEACGLCFVEMYGSIGRNFIEVHHRVPISKLDEHKTEIDIDSGFAVLCSNCHRMIHKLPDTGDLDSLIKLIQKHHH